MACQRHAHSRQPEKPGCAGCAVGELHACAACCVRALLLHWCAGQHGTPGQAAALQQLQAIGWQAIALQGWRQASVKAADHGQRAH